MVWTSKELWNTVPSDMNAGFAQDDGGFFLGVLDGAIIASVSAIKYGKDRGFIGCYICLPEHRGKGFGLRVFKAGMDHLKDRAICLDGVMAQVKNYEKSGFHSTRTVARHRVAAWEVPISSTNPLVEFLDIKTCPTADLVAYDASITKLDRTPAFFESFFQREDGFGLVARSNREIVGIMYTRKAEDGFRVGPWFADSKQVAQYLFEATLTKWAHLLKDQHIHVDVSAENKDAMGLMVSWRGHSYFTMSHMWTSGPEVVEDLSKLYGSFSVELG